MESMVIFMRVNVACAKEGRQPRTVAPCDMRRRCLDRAARRTAMNTAPPRARDRRGGFDRFVDGQADSALFELVEGVVVMMTNPTEVHEQIASNIGAP